MALHYAWGLGASYQSSHNRCTELLAALNKVGKAARTPARLTTAVRYRCAAEHPCSEQVSARLALKNASESTRTMLALRLCTSHPLTASPLPNLEGAAGVQGAERSPW